MRNLLLFLLFLAGVYYFRRAFNKPGGGGTGQPGADSPRQSSPPPVAEIEQMVPCAHCGLHVPESESVKGGGRVYCSEAHRRLGPRD